MRALGGHTLMIKKILLLFCIVTCATLYFAQNHARTHAYIANYITSLFEKNYDCSIDFKVQNVNLFNLSVTLENVKTKPKNHSVAPTQRPTWAWESKTCVVHFSWFSLIGGMLGMHIQFNDLTSHSVIADGHIAVLEDHIRKLVDGPAIDIPLFLKSLTFKNSNIEITSTDPQLHFKVHWDSESKKINDQFKSQILISQGSFGILDRTLATQLEGSISFDATITPDGLVYTSEAFCTADIEQLPEGKRTSFINVSWQTDRGVATIISADQSVIIDPINLKVVDNKLHVDASGKVPLMYPLRLAEPTLPELPVHSSCNVNLACTFAPSLENVSGSFTTEPLRYGAFTLADNIQSSFVRENDQWNGKCVITHAALNTLHGSWQWTEKPSSGSITLKNPTPRNLPGFSGWRVGERDVMLHAEVNSQGDIKGAYHCKTFHDKKESSVDIGGDFSIKKTLCMLTGHANGARYDAKVQLKPQIHIDSLHFFDDHNQPLIVLHTDAQNPNECSGELTFSLFKQAVEKMFAYNLQGEGKLSIKTSLADKELQIKTSLEKGGRIRLPETYNFISGFDAIMSVNIPEKTITMPSMQCTMHNGFISIKDAYASFSEEFDIRTAHLPITFDSCLLNFKKDLFASFSGTMQFTKKIDEIPLLQGHLMIDRSQLKENIFSDTFQKSLFEHTGTMFDAKQTDMKCDIVVHTKNPIRIDTSFFQSSAKVGVQIKNTIRDPHVSGSVELLAGTLNFPYRPLNIIKGNIYFMPHQLHDPIIELVAKNKIKKYDVTLQVTGSLQNHDISLEASPALAEEQVIGLLLVGSHDASLNAMVPALIMQNLKTVLFDSEHSPLKRGSYFEGWLKPFKYVHLVPSFSDQTGRGGLKGAIEVEIGDRFRATAQRNFSLSEDTRFEVEYLLSDDVTIRGIRDERKDVAGEVEMRWKFGG